MVWAGLEKRPCSNSSFKKVSGSFDVVIWVIVFQMGGNNSISEALNLKFDESLENDG